MNARIFGLAIGTHSRATNSLRARRAVWTFLVAAGVTLASTPGAFATRPPDRRRPTRGLLGDKRAPMKRLPAGLLTGNTKVKTPAAPLDPNQPRPTIAAEKSVHDFGTVWVGPALKHTFTIRNNGKTVLNITRVKPSCGCTIAGSYPKSIKPGESGQFPFSINSSKLRGKFEKSITITSNDPATPSLRLRLRGEVKRFVNLVPASVQFGKLYGEEVHEKVIKITNNTETPLQVTLGPITAGRITAKLVETDPGKTFDLTVTAKPPFEPGSFRETLILTTNKPAQKDVKVQVRGTVPKRLELNPAAIVLRTPSSGAPPQTKGMTRVLRLTNYSSKPIKVLSADVNDPAVKTTIKEQSPGKVYNIQVEFPPNYEPPEGGRMITLKTDDPKEGTIEVPIRRWGPPKRKTAPKRPAQAMVGKKTPVFSLKTVDGKTLASNDLGGKVTVLDFFAVNCGFCKKQIPRLEKVRADYEGKGVRFVVVSQTMRNKKFTDEQVIDKVKGLGFRGEIATDPDNTVGPLFKATSYPTMVVLGKTGKVDAVNIGNIANLETQLRGQLDALLAGKPVPTGIIAKATTKTKPKTKRKRPDELIGKMAPTFVIKTLDGKPVSNATFADSPATVLNFVATNCGYCSKQIPRLEKLRETFAPKGVRFVTIFETMRNKTFTEEQVVAKMKSLKANMEIAHDPENLIGPRFYATGFPTMIVIGKDGKVAATNVGNLGDLETRVAAQLQAVIEGKPIPKFAKAKPATRKRANDLIGKPAPKFTIDTLDGKKVANALFSKSKATVLNFVAPNCGYCKKQIPRLEKIRANYEGKGVRFVNVVQTMRKEFTEEEVVATMTKLGSKIELARDPKNKIGKMFGATGFPTMVVIGKTGKIEAVNVGNIADLEKRVPQQLDALIAGKPMPKFASAKKKKGSRRPALDLVGKTAPTFELKTLEGKTVSSDGFKSNSATVLNFVAPNCGFCKRQLPNVEKVRKDYVEKGVRFVNVVQKMRKDFTDEQIIDVFKKTGANLEITTADFASKKVGKLFKAVSFPTMFVVSKEGKIANVNIGAKKDLESLLRGQLDALLKGKPTTQAPTKAGAKTLAAAPKP